MENLTSGIILPEEIIIILLLLASVVAIFAERWRVPYTVGLVLIGLSVIVNMLLVAGIVSWGAGIAFDAALVFGVLIAATDPVAVVALFRKLGAPNRLQVILEGESLFNDGTAIVLFGLMLTAVRTDSFSIIDGLAGFLRVAGGGVMLGAVLTNTATVTAGGGSSTSTADMTILKPDLKVTKDDGSDGFAANSLVVYTIAYENIGGHFASGVYLQETVPSGTTFDAANSTSGWVIAGTSTPCDGAAGGTVCRYEVGQVNPGAAAGSVEFATQVGAGYTAATLDNTVTIADDGTYGQDHDASNNTATDSNLRTQLSKSLLSTNQAFTTGSDVAIGEILTYRLVWTIPAGSTPVTIPAATITDTLDAGLAIPKTRTGSPD